MTDRDHLVAQIVRTDAREFCETQLFSIENWLFDQSGTSELLGNYSDFRESIASVINIDADAVRLVGSARFGFSMNPRKGIRAFNDESDLDVVIVSQELYHTIWFEFRSAYYNGYTWIKSRHSGDIFRRFLHVLPDGNYNSEYLKDTARRLDNMRRQVNLSTGLARELKYRIYEDWDAALDYHAHGVRKLQRMLLDEPQ